MLEINEGLHGRVRPRAFGRSMHAARPFESVPAGESNLCAAFGTGGTSRQFAGGKRLIDRRLQIVGAIAGADGEALLGIDAGQEALGCGVELHLAARLREEVHRWRPARRDEQRIDGDLAKVPPPLRATLIEAIRSLPVVLTTE